MRLLYSALLVAVLASTLPAAPAGASLYMYQIPGAEIASIRLSATAAPVFGANQTGQFHALVIEEKSPDGYRISKSSLTAARIGGEVTIDLASATLYGASRLDGTFRKGALSLAAQAEDGTVHRLSFEEVSEDRWNAAVAKFKQVARLARFGYELRRWSDEDQQALARLAENKKRFADAQAEQAEAKEALQSATKAYESGKRRLGAAQEANEAATELAAACLDCGSVGAIHSAKELVERVERGIAYEAEHIRGDEATSLGQFASMKHDLGEKTRAVRSDPPRPDDNYDAQSAGYDVQSVAYSVESAVYALERALYGLEQDESEAESTASSAAGSVQAFEKAIANDEAQVREARRRVMEISNATAELRKKLGIDKRRR